MRLSFLQKAKEIFERLNAFKLEIMNRRRIDNAEEQKEADEVWDKLRRDLRLGDEAQPDSEEALSVSEEHGQGLEHYLQAAGAGDQNCRLITNLSWIIINRKHPPGSCKLSISQ